MSQAEITRRRILDAATTEFARHGIAGARVDRIAEQSGMSKPMIYTHFGAKEALFDAVFDAHVLANKGRVPFSVDDLPGYAARLYDDYLADPALVRLLMWKRLEREPEGYLFAGLEAHDADHRAEIAAAQDRGVIRGDVAPADVWSIVIAIAATWAQNSITAVATSSDPSGEHLRRRGAVSLAVRDALHAHPGSGAPVSAADLPV